MRGNDGSFRKCQGVASGLQGLKLLSVGIGISKMMGNDGPAFAGILLRGKGNGRSGVFG